MNPNPAVRVLSIVFKIVLALVVVSGVATSLALTKTSYDFFNTFAFFTIQSNLIVLGAAVYGAVRLMLGRPEGRLAVVVRHGATLWILITGLVFHFMLGGFFRFSGAMAWVSWSLHYLSPLMTVLNWILFEEKGRARCIHDLYWLAYPLLYVAVSLVRFAMDGFAPYWFLNPVKPPPAGTGGVGPMLLIIGVLVAVFSAVGLLIILLDRLMGRRKAAVKAEE